MSMTSNYFQTMSLALILNFFKPCVRRDVEEKKNGNRLCFP